jgi:hypothetical protein
MLNTKNFQLSMSSDIEGLKVWQSFDDVDIKDLTRDKFRLDYGEEYLTILECKDGVLLTNSQFQANSLYHVKGSQFVSSLSASLWSIRSTSDYF